MRRRQNINIVSSKKQSVQTKVENENVKADEPKVQEAETKVEVQEPQQIEPTNQEKDMEPEQNNGEPESVDSPIPASTDDTAPVSTAKDDHFVDPSKLIKFIIAAHNGDVNQVREEIKPLYKIYGDNIKTYPFIEELCKTLIEPTTIHEERAVHEEKTLQINDLSKSIVNLAEERCLGRISVIKFLLTEGFKPHNAAIVIINDFLKIQFDEPKNRLSNIKINDKAYSKAITLYDFFRELMQFTDIKIIPTDIKKNIYKFYPFVLEVLISRGLNVMEEIDGNTIIYYAMRSAVKTVQITSNETLGSQFIKKLQSSSQMKYYPWYFTNCSDTIVYSIISSKPDFINNITQLMPNNELYITTIEDERIYANLISLGSPSKIHNLFNPVLANKILHIKNMKTEIAKHTSKNEHDLTLFSFFITSGNFSPQHIEVLKYIFEIAPNNSLNLSYSDEKVIPKMRILMWGPMHIAFNHYVYGRNKDNFIDLMKFLYNQTIKYGKFTFDLLGRTPLMCITFPSNEEEDQELNDIIDELIPLEIKGLKENGYHLSKEEFKLFIQNWIIKEANARKADQKFRNMFARQSYLEALPWKKKQ